MCTGHGGNDAAAAQMPHGAVLLCPEKGCAGAHGGHHGLLLAGKRQSAHAAGGELVHAAGGQAIDITLHIGSPHTGQDDPADVLQRQMVAGEIIAEGAVETGHLVLSPDAQHGDHTAVSSQSHNFCGGTADIDA